MVPISVSIYSLGIKHYYYVVKELEIDPKKVKN